MSKADKKQYNPQEVEAKWQKEWQEKGIYQPDLENAKKPYYNLHMFPYPSAEGLHVGNVYAFTGADIYGRFKRMQGYDLFQPFGLDGFGIHSENYALKVGSHPMDQAEKSEKRFYAQVHSLGSGYDWSHTLETYAPEYYKWTQWIFTELFKAGLAYREKVPVNFCPSCKTVLADEQVIDGQCERCGSVVEKRDLEQWMFRITEYAEQLLDGLDRIDWTEKVKIAQRNWIGKSTGARIKFRVVDTQIDIGVFTTRPDTLYGATFLVVSPEHPVVDRWLDNPGVREYVEASKAKSERDRIAEGKEKTGVFSGVYALNPVTNKQIPIWIADYVLMSYGTGAIMAVPAHDERDFEFAKKYDIPIVQVVAPETGPRRENEERRDGGCAIIFDPETQKYAVATHPNGLVHLFAGGVDDGEDLQEGVLREVREESGLYDFGHTEPILTAFAHFYNSRKEVNRLALATCYLVILKSKKLQPTHQEEHEKGFRLSWMSPEEILENWKSRNNAVGLEHWIMFLNLAVARAIELGVDTTSQSSAFKTSAYTGEGSLINSGEWNGWDMPKDKEKVIADLKKRGTGEGYTNYHLRDWLISRQRYWGPPIPMLFCESCARQGKSWFTTEKAQNHPKLFKHLDRTLDQVAGWYPEEVLPVELPYIDDYKPLGTGNSPLGNHPEFYETTCPECGGKARRETDVSDTFLDSSWYFLGYLATDTPHIPFPSAAFTTGEGVTRLHPKMAPEEIGELSTETEKAKARLPWLPVTIYTGGAEHSVLHLLYTRFLYKVFCDLGYVDSAKGDEPFPRFFAHGLIIKDGAKMSKSKGNVVVPDEYIKKFGADTLRSYLMFLGPFNMGGDFRDSGIEGMSRFIKRIWTLGTGRLSDSTELDPSAKSEMHQTIKGVTEDIGSFRYNTAIAKIMTYYNYLSRKDQASKQEVKVMLQLFTPFAPHITDELWHQLGENSSINTSAWPQYDSEAISHGDIVVAVQVNGKLRTTLKIHDISLPQPEIEALAKEQETVSKHLEAKSIRKIIYVPGKILNFVVS